MHNGELIAESSKLSPEGSTVGFQLSERYLDWDCSAARQLIKIYVAQNLNRSIEWVDDRLLAVSALLPDLMSKLEILKADLVLQLLSDPDRLAFRLLQLKQELPEANLTLMLSKSPWLLSDEPTIEELGRQMKRLTVALPKVRVQALVQEEPSLLLCDIYEVLSEIRRVVPEGVDPISVLIANPSSVLDMRKAGLQASLAIDDGLQSL